jgi:hypothetical protein
MNANPFISSLELSFPFTLTIALIHMLRVAWFLPNRPGMTHCETPTSPLSLKNVSPVSADATPGDTKAIDVRDATSNPHSASKIVIAVSFPLDLARQQYNKSYYGWRETPYALCRPEGYVSVSVFQI